MEAELGPEAGTLIGDVGVPSSLLTAVPNTSSKSRFWTGAGLLSLCLLCTTLDHIFHCSLDWVLKASGIKCNLSERLTFFFFFTVFLNYITINWQHLLKLHSWPSPVWKTISKWKIWEMSFWLFFKTSATGDSEQNQEA